MSTNQHPLTDETRDRLVSYISGGTIDCSSEVGRYDSLAEDDARRIIDSLWGPMTEAAFDAGREHERAQAEPIEITEEMWDASCEHEREHAAQDRPAEITDEMALAALNEYVDDEMTGLGGFFEDEVLRMRAALTAALTVDARPWEPLNGPVRVGDEVRRDHSGLTTIAVVGRVDKSGDPWTAEGACIGLLRYGTWYVRRAPAHTTEKETPMTETTTPAEPLARTLLAVPAGHGAPHHDEGRIKADDIVLQMDDNGVIRAGRAYHQDEDGDWRSKGGRVITWAARRADRPDALTVWPAPAPPADEVELPSEPCVLTDVRLREALVAGLALWTGREVVVTGFDGLAAVYPISDLTTFTLPDGTRARRDGDRFIKAQEGEK